MEKGLLVNVYRNSLGDCTNNGVSSKFNSLTLVSDEKGSQVFDAREDRPALYVAKWYGELIACPENLEATVANDCQEHLKRIVREDSRSSIKHLNGWMFGGNFIYSSDSRFPDRRPIAVFDRRED